MFYVFIDFEKAFDTVWREDLRCKLLMNHINGKMHIVIVNIYHNVKSRITYDNEFSEYLRVGTESEKEIFINFSISFILKWFGNIFRK